MKNLPKDFITELDKMGHPAFRNLPEVIATTSPEVSVRVNPRCQVAMPFPEAEPVAWNPEGFYLASRPEFTMDPRLHQGVYYVQEASSMAISTAVGKAVELLGIEGRPLHYLDACAAPGGKTTAAIDALPDDAFVVANEFDPRRAQILVENLAKWGAEAYVTRGDASQMRFPRDFFDIIAADVPCSGEGMMRKDDFAIEQWSPKLVSECSVRQQSIVANLWDFLRPGGIMIYSTCTFNTAENEEIIQWLIDEYGAEPIAVPLDFEGILGAMGNHDFPACRFVPGAVRGEGLFMAMLRKPGDFQKTKCKVQSTKDKGQRTKVKNTLNLDKFLEGNYKLVEDEPLRAVREEHLPLYEAIGKMVRPLTAGIELGALKGKDFIPSQALALSRNYKRGAYPEYEVDKPTALTYLRREALALPDAPRGLVLLTYEKMPLGWIKNLGTRANNLYPDQWRIRKAIVGD